MAFRRLLTCALLCHGTAALAQDRDADGVPDSVDTCPDEANPNQQHRFLQAPKGIGSENAPWELAIGDLDGDGDTDVVSCSQDGLGWRPNQGGGTFGTLTLLSTDACVSNAVFDLDDDGDQDVIGSCGASSDDVCRFENLGGGTFGPAQVIGSTTYAYGVTAGDFDGDGDGDVAVAGYVADTVSWFENLGGSFGPEQVLTDRANSAVWVGTPDLDGDGDPDLMYAAGFFRENQIAWFENLGGTFGPVRLISTATQNLDEADAADLDGDGDLDVLVSSALEGVVGWLANDGAGDFGPLQPIVTLPLARTTAAADLDGDGDLDVIAGSGGTDYAYDLVGEVVWLENLGAGTFGPAEPLGSWSARVRAVLAADADADGDLDVLYAATEADEIGWFDNAGFPSDLDEDGTCDASDPDADGDGVEPPADCDDLDPERLPGATDPFGDGIDQNCDGVDGDYEPGTTPQDTAPPVDTGAGDTDDTDEPVDTGTADDGGKGCGCATPGAPTALGLSLLPLVALRRRRRA